MSVFREYYDKITHQIAERYLFYHETDSETELKQKLIHTNLWWEIIDVIRSAIRKTLKMFLKNVDFLGKIPVISDKIKSVKDLKSKHRKILKKLLIWLKLGGLESSKKTYCYTS